MQANPPATRKNWTKPEMKELTVNAGGGGNADGLGGDSMVP